MILGDYKYYVRFSIHFTCLYSPTSQMYLGRTFPNWNKKLIAVIIYGKFSVTHSLLLLFQRSSQCTLIITFDLQNWIMVHIASYLYEQVQFIWIDCHQIPFTIMKSPLKFASLSTLNPCLSVGSSNQALSSSTSLILVAAQTSLKASFSKFLWAYGQLARIIS